MPKVGKVSEEQKRLAEDIRKDFGGQHVISAKQVGLVLGMKSHHTTAAWLLPLKPRDLNGRKGYLVLDVAGKILEG